MRASGRDVDAGLVEEPLRLTAEGLVRSVGLVGVAVDRLCHREGAVDLEVLLDDADAETARFGLVDRVVRLVLDQH